MTTAQEARDQAEQVTAYQCEACGALSEEEAGPLYECGECGTQFNRETSYNFNHQCPNCDNHKFSSKIAAQSCYECNEGEVSEVEAFRCTICGDDELLEGEDALNEHIADYHTDEE